MNHRSRPSVVSDQDMANAIRALAMDAVEKAQSGHPGMPMGMADVATVLFTQFLKFDPQDPHWPNRDRFVLSAGHGSMLLYAVLYLCGYADMTLDEIKNFRQMGSRTAGHPEYGHASGIETTTGPLGQGLANAVGIALAEKHLSAEFGGDLLNHHTYVIVGDGCLMEGISQEAITFAAHYNLNKLIVLFDDNKISIDGATSLSTSENQITRFQACGWNTQSIDGHNPKEISQAILQAQQSQRPSLIACRTIIGYGAPKKAGSAATHGSPLGADEIAGARQKLGWDHPAFFIPEPIRQAWLTAASRHQITRKKWLDILAKHPLQKKFQQRLNHQLTDNIQQPLLQLKQQMAASGSKLATRQSSQLVLDTLMPLLKELLGGSADLTGSNNTKAKNTSLLDAKSPGGHYIHYGIREHAMAAMMNGLALYGGIIPFGGTFLVFSDYAKPAIRLSALMGLRVIYVLTHDSIGLGEDGPTHQPIEQLASLRSIPNILVLRPADSIETAESWEIALEQTNRPSAIVLTRQAVPLVRSSPFAENLSKRGGYVLRKSALTSQITLISTGSEISVALDAQSQLEKNNIGSTVVSMPCWRLFDEQPASYQQQVLGKSGVLKVAIEAAADFGWHKYIGENGIFVGMSGFGASGPASDLYKHFKITAENVVEKIVQRLSTIPKK